MGKFKIEIKWAFIFMGVLLLWMVLERVTGLHSTHIDKQQYLTLLYIIPAVWLYVLALKDKKKDFNGHMSFKQGFISGLIISLIVTVITPDYFTNVIAHSVKTGYFKTMAEAEAYFNYKNYAIQSTIWALVMGIITSLIVAFFVRSKTK